MNFEAAAIAYIRHVMDERDVSAGALAKGAGVSPSTLTRALNDPDHKFTLSMKTIEKIANFSGINPAPFLEAKNSADLTTGFYHRGDVYLSEDDAFLNKIATTNTIVIGEIAAGKWRAPGLVPIYDYGPLSLTSTFDPPADCFACIVRGESASSIAGDGDILFCVKYDAKKQWGDKLDKTGRAIAVVVERKSQDGLKIELTVRFLKRQPDHWALLSGCTADLLGENKRPLIKALKLDNPSGNDDLSIIGTVEWVIRGDTHDALNYVMFEHS